LLYRVERAHFSPSPSSPPRSDGGSLVAALAGTRFERAMGVRIDRLFIGGEEWEL